MNTKKGFLWADIAGLALSPEDREILSHPFISGVILFSRNYESVQQLQALTQQIKSISSELIITIDQEGGRVQRFRDGFTELPSMQSWGLQYVAASTAEKHTVKNNFSKTIFTMISELKNVGVYSSFVPVLDLDYNRSEIIGHRSFGQCAHIVTDLANFMIDECHHLKMPVTGKHFPGHGWVAVDSHLDLPVDERSFNIILKNDIKPYEKLAAKLDAIMLAHIVYEDMDALPVCFSSFWIRDILRKKLHFDGLIMSDDLSMQAIAKKWGYIEATNKALTAGCDIVLVCNSRDGVIEILDYVHPSKNIDLERRLKHYSRFCVDTTIR